jgi:hypothetical protein
MATKARSTVRSARERARDALEESLRQLEKQLPDNLSRMVRRLRANLRDLQAQMERLRVDREARWNRIQTQVRRDAARLFRRLEKAVEPKPERRTGPKKKRASRKPRASARVKTALRGAMPRISEPRSLATREPARRTLPLAAATRSTEPSRPIGEPPTAD